MQQQHTTDARTASIPLSSALARRIAANTRTAAAHGGEQAAEFLPAVARVAKRMASGKGLATDMRTIGAMFDYAAVDVDDVGRDLLDRIALDVVELRRIAALERELLVS